MKQEDYLQDFLQAFSDNSDVSKEDIGRFFGSSLEEPDFSLKGLKLAHSELCTQLESFELMSAIQLIAGLGTIASMQDNSLRIDVLQHLAFACCRGDQEAGVADLREWMKLMRKSPVSYQEDPPEDVFVGYVCSTDGGFRVFPGLISHADFILERLLAFLCEKVSSPGYGDAYESVIEFLKLSDAVAGELGYPRYYTQSDRPEADLFLPETSKIVVHRDAVNFSRARLRDLGIDCSKLSSFAYDISKIDSFSSEGLLGSSLERCPLLVVDGGILVVAPGAMCRAAVMCILEVAPNMGGWAETFFEKESAEFFINRVLQGIGVERLDGVRLPAMPEILPSLYGYTGQFDFGMPVLAFTRSSSIIQGSDLEEIETFSEEQVEAFTEYLGSCCETLEALEGFNGGLVLLALSGVGRPMAMGLKQLRPGWKFYMAALAEWFTLSSEHDFTARRLWYLGEQQVLAEQANMRLINVGELVNLYGYWRQNYFSLVPAAVNPYNPNNMMALGGDYSQDVNVRLKCISDRHSQWHPLEERWVELQRQGEGLDPDLRTHLQYCDYGSVHQGVLRGCVSKGAVAWWVEVNEHPKESAAFSMVYQLWDCVMSWVERILQQLDAEHVGWSPEMAVLRLKLHDVDIWDLQTVTQGKSDEGEIDYNTYQSKKLVELTIGEDFLSKFHREDNLAEREIVAVLIKALSVLGHAQLEIDEVDAWVWKVVCDEHARFFHVLRSVSLESVIGEGRAKPLLIPDEEVSRVRIGLAHTIDSNPPEKISDRDEARVFLDKVVGGIQGRLSKRLKRYQSIPVLSHSFNQLDELSRDGARWEISTRSLLSLEGHAEWLHERLRLENARATLAEIANRALIEMTTYSHNSSAEVEISQTEHLSLLAEIVVMFQLASYRDAVANGLVDPEVIIRPNGQIDYDDAFQDKIMQPYLTTRSDDRIRWNAESYGEHFIDPDTEEDLPEVHPELESFERAFVAEYGFESLSLDKFADEFARRAIETGEGGGLIDESTLRVVLRCRLRFSETQADTFIDRFILRIRPAWNKGWPDGYQVNDVLPWRFFRGLSVLVRPIVEVSLSPKVYAVSATHLQRWRRYFLSSVIECDLPDRIFKSEEMKAYRGAFSKYKGDKFEARVVEELEHIVPEIRQRVKMRAMGKADADPSDDVDVIAWDQEAGVVFLMECKHLKPVLTVAQVIRQLQDFRGAPENNEDYLAKHLRRVKWLQANPDEVAKLTGIPVGRIRWLPLLVCSGRVPMAHADVIDFPKEQVVAFQDLVTRVQKMMNDKI